MIQGIAVKNFMRIDDRVEIQLGPVTILVGANGSGKSSILKAVHWAVRCATLRDHNNNTTLDQMDYTPSRDFLQLGHKRRLQNREEMPKVCVTFIGDDGAETNIQLSAARNDAGAKALVSGPLASALTTETPATAYIPGLAGLSEAETLLATPVLHRRAASGEGGSVLRHILLELAGGSAGTGSEFVSLVELDRWVGKVIPSIQFWVKFDRLRDVNIEALFLTDAMKALGRGAAHQRKPLEMAGTGYLQVVQIFAYLLKFRPKLLLIDEPDAHLHPGTQELLIRAIEEAAIEFPDTKFVISTHSPRLVRACGEQTRVRWIDNGQLRPESEETVRQRMGWGVLDKELIIFTEDEKTLYMQNLLDQWPSLARRILLWPTFGASGLPHGDALAKIRASLGVRVMIHRDRDFMSDSDVIEWKTRRDYVKNSIPVWVTEGSDIEAAFLTANQVSSALQISVADAEALLSDALQTLDAVEIERDFNNAITGATSIIPGPQRSIPSARWREMGGFCQQTVKGKVFFPALKSAAQAKFIGTPEARKLGLFQKIFSPVVGYNLSSTLKLQVEAALA